MKRFFYFIENALALILAFVMYSVVEQFYFYPIEIMKHTHLNLNAYIALTVIITILAIFALFYFYFAQLRRKNVFNFNQKPHWSLGRLLLSLLAAFLMILSEIILMLILKIGTTTTSANQANLNEISRQAGQFFMPMITIVGPIFEETIFRGLFFNAFFSNNSSLNRWGGILTSGFVFGLAHDPGLTKFLFIYWMLGCILAWVYTCTKDLRYSIIAHILFNSLGFL